MELNYWDQIKMIPEVTEKYKDFNLEEFIKMTILECGFDETLMNNVYINEIVNYPGSFGCYINQNDNIEAYFINEQGVKRVKEYQNKAEFMLMFITTAPNCKKYDSWKKSM